MKNPELFVGLPFVRLPGRLDDHAVAGETYDGQKIRVAEVEMVFNDMLLMDALHGPGSYAKNATAAELACLEIGERLYGSTSSDAVARWLKFPKVARSIEWPGETR